jgi:hypothetical protein
MESGASAVVVIAVSANWLMVQRPSWMSSAAAMNPPPILRPFRQTSPAGAACEKLRDACSGGFTQG